MSKGIELRLSDLTKINTNVKLLNSQKWELHSGVAYRYVEYFEDGRIRKIYFDNKELAKIFPQIKFLYDRDGEVLAQRISKNCRLLTIKKNKYFFKKKKKNNYLGVYNFIKKIENDEYLKMINEYWYGNNKNEHKFPK